jgi:hypothetical protein
MESLLEKLAAFVRPRSSSRRPLRDLCAAASRGLFADITIVYRNFPAIQKITVSRMLSKIEVTIGKYTTVFFPR